MGVNFLDFLGIFDLILYHHKCRIVKNLKHESRSFLAILYPEIWITQIQYDMSEISYVKDDVLLIFVAHNMFDEMFSLDF